ncbi:MAG: cytochrome d ubiquinol oxidase subunit II [Bacillaceae bacterium]
MSHDALMILWFILWGVIWTMYFIQDSYSLGTGMISSFVTKDRQERNQMQEAIGPFWNGAEVWLILAGGATFAAFPVAYADMFTYLYEGLFLLLFALFFRAAGLEFMHKDDNPKWQRTCLIAFQISSFLIPFLLGVVFSNLYYGLLIGPNGYEGSFFDLLRSYTILGGLLFVFMFMLSGSLWLMIKVKGEMVNRSYTIARFSAVVVPILVAIFYVATNNRTELFATNFTEYPALFALPVITMLIAVLNILAVFKKKIKTAFTLALLTIAMFMTTGFSAMYPNMLPSRIAPEFSLSLFEAAGSEMNLTILTFVAAVMVPVVIGYQLWSYYFFREKISKEAAKGYR